MSEINAWDVWGLLLFATVGWVVILGLMRNCERLQRRCREQEAQTRKYRSLWRMSMDDCEETQAKSTNPKEGEANGKKATH